ncbi:MAG: TonB family protein [Acidobacteria bacterium]|nr:TonB family protein [Acidobacteriota bacterium]
MKQFLFSVFLTLLFCLITFAQDSNQKEDITCKNCAVQLKVELLNSGKIGNTSLFSSSCSDKNFEQQALDAAKKIKFEPQENDGKPITFTKTVKYTFTCLGDEKAEAVIKRAIEKLGGEKYLNAKSQIGRGKFSIIRDNATVSFQSFVDVIVFPDKERTDFRGGGSKTVQTNFGSGGWVFDGDAQILKDQTDEQIKNFKRGINTSLDNLLRGNWRGKAALSYVGRRQAGIGKSNDVVKLTFDDGFTVEFEFSDDGLPMKSIYKRTNADNEEITEEDRYAQFIEVSGIKTPFIVDHFSNKMQTSRINYESVEFNKSVPNSIFVKPSNPKDLKKDLKL